jgi:hypothetical protein
MDNYFDMLPKEIINKIMLYNSHPVSDIMKYKMIKYNSYITRWESYTNDDKPMTFSRYTLVRMQLNKTYKRYRFGHGLP